MLPKGFLVGNVASDPQFGVSQNSQRSYTRFSVACNDKFVKVNDVAKTHFFNMVSWERHAKFIKEFVKKGDKVFIEFSVSTSQYVNQEGKTVKSVDLFVDNIEKIGARAAARLESSDSSSSSESDSSNVSDDLETDSISLDEIF